MDPLELDSVDNCTTEFIHGSPAISDDNSFGIDQSYREPIIELVQVVHRGCLDHDVAEKADTEKVESKQNTNFKVEPLVPKNFTVKQEYKELERPKLHQSPGRDYEIEENIEIEKTEELSEKVLHEEVEDIIDDFEKFDDPEENWNLLKAEIKNSDNSSEIPAHPLILCGSCEKEFYSYQMFIEHCKEEHGDKSVIVRCAYCGPTSRQFKNIESLRSHHKYVHRLTRRRCPKCDKIISPKNFNNHIQKVHMHQGLFVCPICKKAFFTPASFKDHRDSHFPDEAKYINCPICKKSVRESYLKRHRRCHRDKDAFMCEICGAMMRNRGNFMSHRSLHSAEINNHLCEICGKNFKTDRGLRVHSNIHSGTAKVKCDICALSLSTMNSLKTHMLIHVDSKPYNCRFCDKGFRTAANRKVHERIHTGERPYQCEICPSAFYGCANLNKHKRKVHCNGKTSNKKYKYNGIPVEVPDIHNADDIKPFSK